MNNPLLEFIQQAGLRTNYFQPNSRYYGLETKVLTSDSGQPISYIGRRIIPPVENFNLLQEHQVVEGERPDLIAYTYLGDPEQFWRICDANAAMSPFELTDRIGSLIRITLPEGIPSTNA